MQKTDTDRGFIRALRFRALTPLYDTFLRLTLPEDKWRSTLVQQARIHAGHRVLDLGCGTGSLSIRIAKEHPGAHLVGIDADPDVLAIASEKARLDGVDVELRRAMAWALPYATGSFDRVVSSLMFHHLKTDDKLRSLREARRLLRPGGEMHIADWGRADTLLMRLAYLSVQALDGFETTSDNVQGRLPDLLHEAGFELAEELRRERTLFGVLSFYRAAARGTNLGIV